MTGYFHGQEFGVPLQGGRHRFDDRHRLGQDLHAPRGELDLVQDYDVATFDDDAALVRAAIFVFVPVVGLRLHRALILDIGDLILVVVGVRAAVFILEAVLVFGVVRALVVDVEDAVLIVVGVWAAVAIFEAVLVFG